MVDLTIAYDILVVMVFLAYICNMSLQILSMVKLINFLTRRKIYRAIASMMLFYMGLIYSSDVFWMQSYQWGLTASLMTKDMDNHCQSYIPQGVLFFLSLNI